MQYRVTLQVARIFFAICAAFVFAGITFIQAPLQKILPSSLTLKGPTFEESDGTFPVVGWPTVSGLQPPLHASVGRVSHLLSAAAVASLIKPATKFATAGGPLTLQPGVPKAGPDTPQTSTGPPVFV